MVASSSTRDRRFNILLLAIDTLRADHLSCYGYRRPTTPALDRLAREGVLCREFWAPGIPTHPSFTTLFTGQHPVRHGIVSQGGRTNLDPATPTLPQVLQAAGYQTASYDNLPRAKAHFGRGFEIQRDPGVKRGCGLMVTAEEVNAELIPFLRAGRDRQRPFFAFAHYWDPHTPYWAPPRYRSLFGPEDPRDRSKRPLAPLLEHPLGKQWNETWLGTVRRDLGLPAGEPFHNADFLSMLYDQEIRHVDDGIATILGVLEEERLAEETLVLVLADHGECLTEHEIHFDHHGLYPENLHVPLIARLPGRIGAGRRVDALIQHLDLLPTLCEAAGIRGPQPLDGKSAWGLWTGARAGEQLAAELVSLECSWQMKWSLRRGGWHYIKALQPDWYGNPPRELYDLGADPGQTCNLADLQAGVAEEMEARLSEWIAARLRSAGRPCDPLPAHGITMIDPNLRRRAAVCL